MLALVLIWCGMTWDAGKPNPDICYTNTQWSYTGMKNCSDKNYSLSELRTFKKHYDSYFRSNFSSADLGPFNPNINYDNYNPHTPHLSDRNYNDISAKTISKSTSVDCITASDGWKMCKNGYTGYGDPSQLSTQTNAVTCIKASDGWKMCGDGQQGYNK